MPKRVIIPLFLHYCFNVFSSAGRGATLAADWITAWKAVRGGFASSQLDHGLSVY